LIRRLLSHSATAKRQQTPEVSSRWPSPAHSQLGASATHSPHLSHLLIGHPVRSLSNDRFQTEASPQSELTFSDDFVIAAINPRVRAIPSPSATETFPPSQIPQPALPPRADFSPRVTPNRIESEEVVSPQARDRRAKTDRFSARGKSVSAVNREPARSRTRELPPLRVLEGLPDDLWSSDGPIPRRRRRVPGNEVHETEETREKEEEEEDAWVQPVVSHWKQEQTRGHDRDYSETDF
jgi:hypothetical protein